VAEKHPACRMAGNHNPRVNEAENPEPQPDIKEAENPEPQPDNKRGS